MRQYELMVIHRSDLIETDVRSQVADIEQAIGTTVTSTDFWGKRRFAYEIEHMNEGFYSVLEFSGDPDLVGSLDRSLSLADGVVRHKILRRFDKE